MYQEPNKSVFSRVAEIIFEDSHSRTVLSTQTIDVVKFCQIQECDTSITPVSICDGSTHSDAPVTLRQLHLLYLRQIRLFYLHILRTRSVRMLLARLSVKLLQITNCKCSLAARGHAVHGLSLDHFCSATFQQNESSVNEQYGCSGILTACTSSVCRLYHLLFTMLLARLAVCPCQIQEQSQLSAKLLQVTNLPRIDVRQSEDKANHDWLTGEAHTERSLSFDTIHARVQIFQLHVHWRRICVLEFAHFIAFLNYLHSCLTVSV